MPGLSTFGGIVPRLCCAWRVVGLLERRPVVRALWRPLLGLETAAESAASGRGRVTGRYRRELWRLFSPLWVVHLRENRGRNQRSISRLGVVEYENIKRLLQVLEHFGGQDNPLRAQFVEGLKQVRDPGDSGSDRTGGGSRSSSASSSSSSSAAGSSSKASARSSGVKRPTTRSASRTSARSSGVKRPTTRSESRTSARSSGVKRTPTRSRSRSSARSAGPR